MNISQIYQLAKSGESAILEYKKSTAQIKRACETLCAFLNGDGGVVLVGVKDNGELAGQEISDKTKREIGNELEKITPTCKVSVNYIQLPDSNKHVVMLHAVSNSANRPYFYNNKAYVRHETNTSAMPNDYLQQLIVSNASGKNAWDNQIIEAITVDDLDADQIIETVKEGCANGRIPEEYMTEDPLLALQRMDLTEGNFIKNAALILFGKKPERIYPQCVLKLARFNGKDKSEFIDNKQISGNLFKQLSHAMEFARMYLPIASTFNPNQIERIDTPLFPIFALREAIANALCHRDYSDHRGSASFAIFDDRLEIWNFGLLPNEISVEELKTLNRSVPRNKIIANVLYYHKIFESWGRGISMIINECVNAGHPEPVYSQDPFGTLLTLPSKQNIGPKIISGEKRFALELDEREQQIMDILLKNENGFSTTQVRDSMTDPKPSERTVRDTLISLQEKGLIFGKGQTNKRRWVIKN